MELYISFFLIVTFFCFGSCDFYTAPCIGRSTFEEKLLPDGWQLEQYDTGSVTREQNPKKNVINDSDFVVKCEADVKYDATLKQRAEYTFGSSSKPTTHPRIPTDEKKLIFSWKGYFDKDFMSVSQVHRSGEGGKWAWMATSQYKTYAKVNGSPTCGEHDGYSTQICGSGGIFNDHHNYEPETISTRFRAEPDCFHTEIPRPFERWFNYILEIYFTNTNKGYFKEYMNGFLIHEENNIKTLFDDFPSDGACNIYYAVGIYTKAYETVQGAKEIAYFDDIGIFDAEVVSVQDIWNKTLYEDLTCGGESNSQGACGNPHNGICVRKNVCECYDDKDCYTFDQKEYPPDSSDEPQDTTDDPFTIIDDIILVSGIVVAVVVGLIVVNLILVSIGCAICCICKKKEKTEDIEMESKF